MSGPRRRRAVLAAVLTAVPAGAGAGAATADLAGESAVVWTLAQDGLVRQDLGTSSVQQPRIVADRADSHRQLRYGRASGDGSRFAYVRVTDVPGGVQYDAVVRDVSGRLVRSLDRGVVCFTCTPLGVELGAVALTPDGTRAVWERVRYLDNTGERTSGSLLSAPVAGGAAVTVRGGEGVRLVDVLGADALLGFRGREAVVLPVAGGVPQVLEGLPGYDSMAASPDGTRIAYLGSADERGTELVVVPVSRGADGWRVGAPVEWDRARFDGRSNLSWTTDGRLLAALEDGSARRYTGAGAFTTVSGVGEVRAAGARDATAPGAPSGLAVTLAGTSARLRFTLPADPDLSGVVVRRSPGGVLRYLPGRPASFLDSGLTVGTTYTWSVSAVDRSGNEATATRQGVATAPPTVTVPVPTSSGSATASFPVRFARGNPSSTRYTVDWRATTSTAWTRWVSGVAGTGRTFGSGATTGVAATRSTPGAAYVFRATAQDVHGNATATTTSPTAVVPQDQARAVFSGSTAAQAGAGRYLGSVQVLRAAGAAATWRATGTALWVVGERCPACGVVDVHLDGVRVATLDTRASATQVRQVLWSRAFARAGAHTVRLVARGTAGRPSVRVDAWGVRP